MQRVLPSPLAMALLKTKWHKNDITQKGIYLVYLLYISSHNCQVLVVVFVTVAGRTQAPQLHLSVCLCVSVWEG